MVHGRKRVASRGGVELWSGLHAKATTEDTRLAYPNASLWSISYMCSYSRHASSNLHRQLYLEQPHLEGKVEYCEVGTPLSNNYYINSVRGESYGLAHTPARFACEWLRPKTPIPGLWLTGQDTFTAGVMGAMMGGYFTAFAMDARVIVKTAATMAGAPFSGAVHHR